MEITGKLQQINGINRIVHEPVRLAILTVLSSAREADFNFLLTALGVTRGNLATHINKLDAVGYVEIRKRFRGKIPHTSYRLTPAGRRAFREYWTNMRGAAPSGGSAV